jgi:hypothetical protein
MTFVPFDRGRAANDHPIDSTLSAGLAAARR